MRRVVFGAGEQRDAAVAATARAAVEPDAQHAVPLPYPGLGFVGAGRRDATLLEHAAQLGRAGLAPG